MANHKGLSPDKAEDMAEAPIPKIIHQIWVGPPMPKRLEPYDEVTIPFFPEISSADAMDLNGKGLSRELICSAIDPVMHEGVEAYINTGRPMGDFLQPLFENKLVEAFGRADLNNRKCMFLWASLLRNHVPAPCWGSKDKMRQWTAERQEDPWTDQRSWTFKSLYVSWS